MPRVVQVPSSETNVVNVYNADSNESEDMFNRNFNQRFDFVTEPITSYMRFPVNYALYNVTYLDSESDPYCLRCVIDGQVKKFKKDARTWLHKSSERKRKLDDETMRNARSEDTGSAQKNLKLAPDAQQFIAFGGAYRSGPYNTDVSNDLLSEISSLGDSEADLTYSEESSPSVNSETRDKYQKSVRFDDTVRTEYREHDISSDSDESLNEVEKTTSSRNIVPQDESECIEGDSNTICTANESRNNMGPGPDPLDISRLAPAISNETESLQESLLDYAVNLLPDCTPPGDRPLSKDVRFNAMRKLKYKKRRQENGAPYYLRSTKKINTSVKKVDTDQLVPSSKQRGQKDTAYKIADVKPAAASMDLVHPQPVYGTDQLPSCSRITENIPEDSSVPKLFVLAGRVLYQRLKSKFNKIK